MTTARATRPPIADEVEAVRFALARPLRFTSEDDLHAAVAAALTSAGIAFEHEAITPQGRLDFRVGEIPVEVKVAGSRAALLRQLDRYASGSAPCVILVSSLRRLCSQMPESIHGVPLHTVLVRRSGGTL